MAGGLGRHLWLTSSAQLMSLSGLADTVLGIPTIPLTTGGIAAVAAAAAAGSFLAAPKKLKEELKRGRRIPACTAAAYFGPSVCNSVDSFAPRVDGTVFPAVAAVFAGEFDAPEVATRRKKVLPVLLATRQENVLQTVS